MIRHRQPPSASPRWPILATLVLGVLGLHLILLAGDIRLPWPGDAPATTSAVTPPTTAGTDPAGTHSAIAPRASPARVSTVRWIVPTPTPAPAATAAPAPKPKPKPKPRPAPPEHGKSVEPPSPTPITEAEPSPPPPIEVRDEESIAPLEPEAVATVPADPVPLVPETPAEAPAPASDAIAAPEPTEPAPPDDDTLVAAAATSKPRGTAAAVQLPPAQPPASMHLQYDVAGNIKGIAYRAEGLLDWTVADGRYSARLDMRVMLLGSRSQSSTGRIGPNGLMPERFADKSRSEKAAHFDAAQQRIRFSNNAPDVPLQPGAQDRLSLFMQLAGLLQARPQAYAAGQTIEMQVAGTGDAPVWRFEVGETSTIRVPAGEFQVRHLVRQPRKEFDSTVEMWLAPSLGHMPVRLRITQPNGDVADQRLRQML